MVGSFEELQPLLQQALEREEVRSDVDLAEAGVMAKGSHEPRSYSGRYVLVVTNVPYLKREKQ